MTRPVPSGPLGLLSPGSSLSPVASLVSWAAVAAVLGWSIVMLVAPAAFGCVAMWMVACSAGSTIAVAALVVAGAVGVRAGWLGAATARGVQSLPRVPIPRALARAAGRGATIRVRCVETNDRVAFCAGLWRPRVYVSVGMVAGLAADELAAVLAHENAHARRRDPLRGLLTRAWADVAFFVPLLRWWQHRRGLRAELAADRAAVEHAGAPALAGALLRLADPDPSTVSPAGAAGFGPTDAVLEARIAALTATPAPRQPPPTRAGLTSVAGVLAVGVVVTCLPALAIMFGG